MSATNLYAKGQSGNPSGMTSELKELSHDMRNKCADIAYHALFVMKDIIHNPEEKGSTRVAAWNCVADRGFGKAIQAIQIDSGTDSIPANLMTKGQLDSFIMGDFMSALKSMCQEGKITVELIKEFGGNQDANNKDAANDNDTKCSEKHQDETKDVLASGSALVEKHDAEDNNKACNTSDHDIIQTPST